MCVLIMKVSHIGQVYQLMSNIDNAVEANSVLKTISGFIGDTGVWFIRRHSVVENIKCKH